MADLQRSIPSMVDGLITGQRKILFCSFKRNFVKEANVAQFSGYVSQHSAYHHGEASLAGTIVGMAQDYVGSNNINLLQPNGQFGTRISGGKDAASARDIFTMLSPVTRVLFPKDDDVLLNYLNEDGQIIEPTWYMPTIPTVLVNGSEGTRTGWSTFIPNYNPRDIVANVRRLLNGESVVPMDPWYRGFKGTIEKTAITEGGASYTVTGIYEELDDTTIRITELPIKRWTDEYKEILLKLKKEKVIQDFKGNSTHDSVEFLVTLTKKTMMAAQDQELSEILKLTTLISTTDMHLLDKKGVIKKYSSPQEILEDFFALRLEFYGKRKEIMLKNLESQLQKQENKIRFIRGVVSGEITLFHRVKADAIKELSYKGFMPFPKKAKFVETVGATDAAEEPKESYGRAQNYMSIPGSQYDYLLSMPVATWATENIKQLYAERDKMKEDVEDLKKATPRSLWLKDLDSLEVELDNLDRMDAEAEVRRQKLRENLGAAAKGRRPQATKKTTKNVSESEATETSNSAMDTGLRHRYNLRSKSKKSRSKILLN